MKSRRFPIAAMAALMFLVIHASAAFAGTETVVHSFSTMPQGAAPNGNLVADSAGNLYGTGSQGGAFGVIFKLTPNKNGGWSETVVHNFTNAPDGAYPSGNLLIDAGGNLYGVTGSGGALGLGTVFRLTPTAQGWKENILLNFDYVGGAYPWAGALTFDSAGNLYGAAARGGSGSCFDASGDQVGCGVVFQLSPGAKGNWVETVLYNFTDSESSGNDAAPGGQLIFDQAGNLYGTAAGFYNGGNIPCGEIFELTPSSGGAWSKSDVYSCGGSNTAGYPAYLVFDHAGNLYVAAASGGTAGSGVVLQFSPPSVSGGNWTETVLYNFGSSNGDGMIPSSLTLDAAGNLYGTTVGGGLNDTTCTGYVAGCGTVFELSPSKRGGWAESILYQFTNGADGDHPNGILRDANGNLYTSEGGGPVCGLLGTAGCGSLLKLTASSNGAWSASVLHDFGSVVDGLQPVGGL